MKYNGYWYSKARTVNIYIDGKKLKYAQKNFMEEWLAYEKQ